MIIVYGGYEKMNKYEKCYNKDRNKMFKRWYVIYERSARLHIKLKKIISEDDTKIVYEDGCIFHKFNTLNDLDNKSWLKFQKSWFLINPPPRGKEVLLHPAKFPEDLVSDFINFFTKKGEIVLDPMLGTGSTLVACVRCGRSGIGIELLEKYAKIAADRTDKEINSLRDKFSKNHYTKNHESCYEIDSISAHFKIILGDSRDVKEMNIPTVDYIITSPPYWNMLREKGFETQAMRKKKNLDTHYSNDERDLGNIDDYERFVDETAEILTRAAIFLRNKRYMTVIVKNVKKKSKFYPLAWDIAKSVEKRGFALKDEKIWCQDNVKIAPYGYGRAWVSNTMHHYCLNFQKI